MCIASVCVYVWGSVGSMGAWVFVVGDVGVWFVWVVYAYG